MNEKLLMSLAYHDMRKDVYGVLRIFKEDDKYILMTHKGLFDVMNCQLRSHTSLYIFVQKNNEVYRLIISTKAIFTGDSCVVDEDDFRVLKQFLLYGI